MILRFNFAVDDKLGPVYHID